MEILTKNHQGNELTLYQDESINDEYWIPEKEVANAFGVHSNLIVQHRRRHPERLIQDKHYIKVTNCHFGGRAGLYWNKLGILALSRLLTSEKSHEFGKSIDEGLLDIEEKTRNAMESLALQLESSINGLREEILSIKKQISPHPDDILDGEVPLSEWLKEQGHHPYNTFSVLRSKKILYYATMKVGTHTKKYNTIYQTYLERKYLTFHRSEFDHHDKKYSYPRIYVTGKGKKWLEKVLSEICE